MQKKNLGKKILYAAGIMVVFLTIAFWILVTFFLDDALTNTGIPKLKEIVRIVTLGRYEVRMSHITHTDGIILCYDFELVRNHYDTSEHGITIERMTIDTLRCTGVSWWNLLWGNSLSMSGMIVNSPRLFFTDASKEKHTPDTVKETITVPPMMIEKANINDVIVYMPGGSRTEPAFRGMNIRLSNFYLDPQHPQNQSLLYSKRIDFELPKADYCLNDTFYMAHIRNMRGSSADSSLALDSFSYMPRYSDVLFAAKHKYATPQFHFRATKIKIQGINLDKFVSGISFELDTISVGSWLVDSYIDRTRPPDSHPPRAAMPNELLLSLPMSVHIHTVVFSDGKLVIRERSATSHETGVLFFDRVTIKVAPITTLDSNDGRPSVMYASAYFVGEGLLRSTWIYPLRHKSFDMDIHATVTEFDAKKLNEWLVPFERTEVESGALDSGKIEMKIRNGVNTTTVTPYYHDLSMKLLPADPKKSRGLVEGIKTFLAKTFILRSDNPTGNKPAVSVTTTSMHMPTQELMEFIWVSLRKSLGGVVGGFQ
jgi:hypothetical protein